MLVKARRGLAREAGCSLRGGVEDVFDVVKVKTGHQAPLSIMTLKELHRRFLRDHTTTSNLKS